MKKRRGVIVVMYDLPTANRLEQRAAEQFRKYLIGHGYVFVQKSIYAKLIRNRAAVSPEISLITKTAPKTGIVNILPLCINDFQKMVSISEHPYNLSLFADDLVIL